MMRAMLGGAVVAAFVALGCGGAGDGLPPLHTVDRVDLDRYLGTWYEIARYPNSFQEGCQATTATYSLRDDGDIKVLNACRKGSPEGPRETAEGKAWIVDEGTNAKLEVQFFWPFSGDYWIIDLGADYEYAVVGHPDRTYFWILSRTPSLEQGVLDGILTRAEAQGYDRSKLIWTQHAE
jgi:apolipoprotein D and lipocalin family protein